MSSTIEEQIQRHEERLREAMLESDVDTLDKLISPDLLFTNQTGQVFGKQDDLAAHREKVLLLREMIPSEQQIRIVGTTAVVSVLMRLTGSFAGSDFHGDFRYTRVWAGSPDKGWQIIAGHMSALQGA